MIKFTKITFLRTLLPWSLVLCVRLQILNYSYLTLTELLEDVKKCQWSKIAGWSSGVLSALVFVQLVRMQF